MKILIAVIVLGTVLEFGSTDDKSIRCRNVPNCEPPCVLDVTGSCPTCDCEIMKVAIVFLVLGAVLEFGDAKKHHKNPPVPKGNSAPAQPARCNSFPVCDPTCVLDVSGPCPYCDCANVCSVSCSGTNCKIVRNGRQCSCVCNGGGGGNVCAISCPRGCRVIRNNGQCACDCSRGGGINNDDGGAVADAVAVSDDGASDAGACAIVCDPGCTPVTTNGQCYCNCNGRCNINCPPGCPPRYDENDGVCRCVCF
ncbi:spider silk-constituting element SpiCE-NMa2A4 [Nephila pilipes]|uniref:Spider silk-constituting element SpiCE-NMa2A4 n=1 Tax=Nephila pilipes TaxID=299642 RepID=A0A8X6UKR5_NEPPI|nr:spider silk-constituting element SpiCE-NMa2A4 [Nephila pilipes]